jgi:catechol 2,3-dioxygenase-like lactoylglutathione lyase family enzyme
MTLHPDRNRIARWTHWLTIAIALWMVLIAGTALAAAREVRAIALTVSDLDAAVTFYEQALGFRKVAERTVVDREHDYLTGVFGTRVRTATLQLGGEFIELDQYLAPAGRPIPGDSRSNDLWFQHFAIVVADMEAAYEHLMRFPVKSISSAPQTIPEWNKPAAGIKAYKFRDPDGHPLELLWFPVDKGNAKWHDPQGRLFLGIDHTAITVADTERSAQFWRDLLGLDVLGGSLNSGETQEQLDNAFGAVVRVTGLRPEGAANGPGVEFLQYVTPGGGRSTPAETRANDLVHARIVLEVADLDALTEKLSGNGTRFVSPRPVKVSGSPWGRQLMVTDPDGHAVLLVQPTN